MLPDFGGYYKEYSSDDEKYGIPEDNVVPAIPAVPWDDVIVISSDEEPEMPAKKVSVKSRKLVFALVDEAIPPSAAINFCFRKRGRHENSPSK
ncbi:hypothetical protein Tco_1060871, partial [Tanacetum coccineum]